MNFCKKKNSISLLSIIFKSSSTPDIRRSFFCRAFKEYGEIFFQNQETCVPLWFRTLASTMALSEINCRIIIIQGEIKAVWRAFNTALPSLWSDNIFKYWLNTDDYALPYHRVSATNSCQIHSFLPCHSQSLPTQVSDTNWKYWRGEDNELTYMQRVISATAAVGGKRRLRNEWLSGEWSDPLGAWLRINSSAQSLKLIA